MSGAIELPQTKANHPSHRKPPLKPPQTTHKTTTGLKSHEMYLYSTSRIGRDGIELLWNVDIGTLGSRSGMGR